MVGYVVVGMVWYCDDFGGDVIECEVFVIGE